MKKKISLKDEAYVLTEASLALLQIFIDDFAEQSTSKGSVAISKESANFVVIMKLGKKKETKQQK